MPGGVIQWLAGLTVSPVVRVAIAEFLDHAVLGILATLLGLLFEISSRLFDPPKDVARLASLWFLRGLHFVFLATASYIVLVGAIETAISITVGAWRRLKLLFHRSAPPARPPRDGVAR